VKSLLDGHICLRKEIAELGILPAIDITQSISRLFTKLKPRDYCGAARAVSNAMSRFIKDRQILLLGGAPDAELQRILDHQRQLFDSVNQSFHAHCSEGETEHSIRALAELLAA
jgi:flagellum-specific ATP synthase